MKHYTIPVFIPQHACPFQCVFCDQRKISGHEEVPSPGDILQYIERHLSTIPPADRHVEIGFFGGTFTGMELEEQAAYLSVAQQYKDRGMVDAIRVSTRPDYIDQERVGLLKEFGVGTVELGAQSMDREVLKKSGRGHSPTQTRKSSEMLLEAGFRLGLQMMIGLPDDTDEKALKTAEEIIYLGAVETRIYPTLIIRGTKLEEMYRKKHYKPLTLSQAVNWTVPLYLLFEKHDVKVIRMGLHPSEGLLSGSELIAGPFHPSFREMVMTRIWWDALKKLKNPDKKQTLKMFVPAHQYNFAVGYEAENRKKLMKKFKEVYFHVDPKLKNREFYAHTS